MLSPSWGEFSICNVRIGASDKWTEEAEGQVPAGLEACLPTVYCLRSLLLPRFHLATQYGIQLRTLIPETPIFFPATICDNHGRLQNPGISSACGVRFRISSCCKANRAIFIFLDLYFYQIGAHMR